jgi:hypothetical protein
MPLTNTVSDRIDAQSLVVGEDFATPYKHSKGGQFVAHVKALPGNPYDGHTLETVSPGMEQQI